MSTQATLSYWLDPHPPYNVSVPFYAVDAVWSTSSLSLPPLQGVAATPPAPGELLEAMDEELVVLHLRNTSHRGRATLADPGRAHVLLVLSTALSPTLGGAPVRQLSLRLRADVKATKPVEPDYVQGWGFLPDVSGVARGSSPKGLSPTFQGRRECFTSWWGSIMPLQLAGGSAQLVEYYTIDDKAGGEGRGGAAAAAAARHDARIGRAPPRRAWAL